MANIFKLFGVADGETVKQLRHKNHIKSYDTPQSHFPLQATKAEKQQP